MPTSSSTWRQNAAPSRYWRILASRPSSRRTILSGPLTLAPDVELRPDLRDARHDLGPDAVHDDVGVALEQRHHGGDLVDDRPLRRGLHEVDDRQLLALADRPRRCGGPPRARPAPSDAVVEVGGRDEPADEAEQVVAQPRHGRELHAVGLLVQAHPQPEVARRDAQQPLDLDDVRRDQQQPALRPVGPGPERVELPEHLRRQIAQQHAHLGTGHPRAEARRPAGSTRASRRRGRSAGSAAAGTRRGWPGSSPAGRPRGRARCPSRRPARSPAVT